MSFMAFSLMKVARIGRERCGISHTDKISLASPPPVRARWENWRTK
jgi:hypothetical protein